MARTAKLHNPHLLAVNPFGETLAKRLRKSTKSTALAKRNGKRKNPSTVRAQRNPDFGKVLIRGAAAGVGALATTFVANLLPLPVNPLLNAGAKAVVGVGIGYVAGMWGKTKELADYVMAGGVGVAAADGLRFMVPKLRTIIVPSEPQAAAVQQATQGQLNDIVVVDDGQMGDIVDSMPYDSEWAH